MTMKEHSDDIHLLKKLKMVLSVCLIYNGMRREAEAVKNIVLEYCVGDIKWSSFNVQLTHSEVQANVEEGVLMVGNRLVFDNGGYNIEIGPGCLLELMKFDMGEAATVLDAAEALEQIGPVGVEEHFMAVDRIWGDPGWNLSFRRFLNDWEIDRLAEFYNTLEQFTGLSTNVDSLLWGGSAQGKFTVMSTYKELTSPIIRLVVVPGN
nr:uncharacterized protein LOC117280127 [Nicotiana tomentosiformis]